MASDGCQEVAWKGNAFSYLLHHPADPAASHSYAERAHDAAVLPSQGQASDVHARVYPNASLLLEQAAAGTWNGAAPRGFLSKDQHGSRVEPTKPTLQRPEPRDTIVGSRRMPLLGFGTWQVPAATAADSVRAALAAGFRHFDCASIYGNEAEVGAGLSAFLGERRREELFITSKVWNNAHKSEALRAACVKSIADLGCQYLDLYLIHWPVAFAAGTDVDPTVSLQETWQAMEALVDDGLVKAIGVSNFSLKQVEDLLATCRIKPVVNQVELHPLLSQRKLVGTLLRKGVQVVAYSPLASAKNGSQLRDHPVVKELAAQSGRTPAQILLRWSVQRGVPALVRTSSLEHMKENLDVFGWKLTEYQKVALDALNENKRFIAPSWATFPDPEDGGVTKPSVAFGNGKHYS